jgi:hypothetical protein
MPTILNECLPLFERADELTGQCSVAVTGKKFVTITGNMQLDNTATIGPPVAGGRCLGVAMYDCAVGKRVGIWVKRGLILPVITGAASGAMAALAEVQVDATGAVIPLAAGVAVGYLYTGTAGNGADAWLVKY